ncbi:ABC transporter permease [Pseudochelatococcus contaminans]|uniref:ABC-2 type transport system permease protein n=1 Tax=Pseudochelatococcus contaminans TaxID=1538103 RepID=A0A7W6EI07_9HYPH|nr:ABC transporter permease [Pseudochelatococcus contaminans]MBB3810217.1 ABC-2 type transport system permease protein [Pseudochelatococcus contaminans]
MLSSTVVQLGIKELRGLSRDVVMLFLIIFSFTFSVYSAATSAPETLNRATIAIIDEDLSPLSGRIATSFYPPYFLKPGMITHAEMDRRMDEGLDTFALSIPPNFQRDLLAGKSPVIQLNVDATRMTQAFSGGGYVQSIVSGEVSEFLQRYRASTELPVDLTLRARFNPELNKGWFGAITSIMNSITMLAIVLAGAALIREREHGTIEHLLVMPVTPMEIMVSKIWSTGLVVLVASTFSLVVIAQGILQIPLQGSLALFLLGTVLLLFATTSLGIFLATVSGSMPQFGLMLVLLPLQVLSGASTPRESMPEFVQYIMLAAPNTHFVILAQAILFRGAGIDVVWPQLVALLVIGALLFSLSLRRFRAFLK